jgi:hypothetical protein
MKLSHSYFLTGFIILTSCCFIIAAPYEILNKNFNRLTSHCMVRKIDRPTEANLDASMYLENPMRNDYQQVTPRKPAKNIRIVDCTFGGTIDFPCTSISKTPLTESEKDNPLAWEPLQMHLWSVTKSNFFAKITSAVNGKKWADSSIFMSYQEIACAYLHEEGDSVSLWVKIEFKPWVAFLDGINDENHDGFRECYGRINLSGLGKNLRDTATNWIQSVYAGKLLTKNQVADWANTLVSYWYPRLNTDIIDTTGESAWPATETEKEVRRELKGFSVARPQVVIRGTPSGRLVYNVLAINFSDGNRIDIVPDVKNTAAITPVKSRHTDTCISLSFKQNDACFYRETKTFGDYAAWYAKESPFRLSAAKYLATIDKDQRAIVGKDGWLFYRDDLYGMNQGEVQASDNNPLQRLKELKTFFDEQGIDFLYCPIPDKSDIYFEKLPVDTSSLLGAVINPYYRKFLHDLQLAGIEVIDLLPVFQSAKENDSLYKKVLFQVHDSHWATPGIIVAAEYIANRIRQYSWYKATATPPIHYTFKDTTCLRTGDLICMLPAAERTVYPPDRLDVQQVISPDASVFKSDNPDAPIMIIGDSFAGMFETTSCNGAGLGAHIAAATGIPVDIVASCVDQSRNKLLRARKNNLPKKRCIIQLITARHLYRYALWTPLQIPLQDK